MISGPVQFEEIIQSVKDETGIVNMRPLYDKLRRYVFRAEREIGYGGSVVLKRCIFKKNIGGFDGLYAKYPDDFIEHEGIGTSEYGVFSKYTYNQTPDGIRFREVQQKIVMLYWGLACDGYCNPITTRNHEEAVVAFCVWKLYAVKRFLDKGNANTSEDYKRSWISALLEARGDDAFPALDEMDELSLLGYSDRRGLMQYPTAAYSYCDDSLIIDNCCGDHDGPIPPTPATMYYWQLDTPAKTMEDVFEDFSINYLEQKPSLDLAQFLTGMTVGYNLIGRICFAIRNTDSQNWLITDALNNNVTDQFTTFYNLELRTMVFVSIQYYTYSSIFFKFKDLS